MMNRITMTTTALFMSSMNLTDFDQKSSHVGLRSNPIPSWKLPEIIRLVILPILFAVGAPLNLAALSHLMSERKYTSSVAARMHLLKLHLNISDLMILFVYTASQICWLITYEWRGGDMLCKLVKFSHTLSFGISSNVVVCIAFDRLASIFESKRRRSDDRSRNPGLRRVKISLLLAWLSAVVASAPQFVVWTTHRPFPVSNPTWTQCVSVFYVHEAAVKRNPNSTNHNPLIITKTGYAAFHVLVIFWIPAFIIAVCYLTVMAWLVCQGRNLGQCWQCCFGKIRKRFSTDSQMGQNSVQSSSTHRYSVVGKGKSAQVGVLIEEDPEPDARGGQRASIFYGTLEPPDLSGPRGSVNLANPTSPKGSGCSSTPLLATAVDHSQGASSRTASANIALTPAVLDLQRVKRRAMRSSVLLVIAYIATWLPYNMIALWGIIDEPHYKQYGINVSFLQYLIVFNSVINPFLYGTIGRLKRYVTNS